MEDRFEESARQGRTPVTSDEVISLPDAELDDRIWLRLCTLIDVSDPTDLASLDEGVRAYVSTRLFEWEIGNGGLHQYFFNFPDPELLGLVLAGYAALGLDDTRALVIEAVRPVAEREAEWRASLRDGTIETFFESYPETALSEFDEQIGFHDEERIAFVRAHPEAFAR